MTRPTADLDTDVRGLMNGDPGVLVDPFSLYRAIREQGGIYELDSVVLLTRYEDVKEAYRLGDGYVRGVRDSQHLQTLRARLAPELQDAWQEVADFSASFMIRSRHDVHHRLRKVAHRAFTPRRIAALDASIREHARSLLGEASSDGECDLGPFAYRMPLLVLMDMLGIPPADHAVVHEWSGKITLQIGSVGSIDHEILGNAHQAKREFTGYIEDMLSTRLRSLSSRSDLLGDLLDAEGEGRMTTDEVVAMFAEILIAGHETTTALIGNGLLEMLRRRPQWHWLTQEPERAGAAVEELLRFVSPVAANPRTAAVGGVEFGGKRYPVGTTILPLVAAANRDPEVFEHPEELELSRTDAGGHLAFGFGPHFCIGNRLARREATVAFQTLAHRFPDMELSDQDPEWYGTVMLRRPRTLSVRLGPNRGPGAVEPRLSPVGDPAPTA